MKSSLDGFTYANALWRSHILSHTLLHLQCGPKSISYQYLSIPWVAYENGNFAKIMHLLWKLRYRNKIIGCKYKRISCNENICRMRANVWRTLSHSKAFAKKVLLRKQAAHLMACVFDLHCAQCTLTPIEKGTNRHTHTPIHIHNAGRNMCKCFHTVQFLTALIEKHNLWFQTELQCIASAILVQPNFWHMEIIFSSTCILHLV